MTAEGVGGLYKGFWPTLMRDIPEIAIQVCNRSHAVFSVAADKNVIFISAKSLFIDVSGVHNFWQFGVYEKLRSIVQKKRNVTKLT